ncbi:MAG TPA: glycosyltransferase family 2 protein [Bryobacteraceae bacterium]|nr:glycosyltransferase family 2 protein [Bryobacteraceae bacterium]
MVGPVVTVVIPTLNAGPALDDCLAALARQTYREFDIVTVDNSGCGRVRREHTLGERTSVIENPSNAGFGAAANQGFRASAARYIAVLNDDATPRPPWLEALVGAIESDNGIGMCASRVLLESGMIDSAGMLIAADGSSKQRGHGQPAEAWSAPGDVLLPSGSAALYRRDMLDEVGMFEESFFVYCEDTDLGLRARRAGWRCVYVPEAIVDHRYSQSAGRASALKAWYVERNRIRTVIRNLPGRALLRVPFATLARYFWHVWFLLKGRGAAAEYSRATGAASLVWIVVKAHLAGLGDLPRLLRERRAIQATARLSAREFMCLLEQHRISLREVASL